MHVITVTDTNSGPPDDPINEPMDLDSAVLPTRPSQPA